jgi:hypothetical protein
MKSFRKTILALGLCGILASCSNVSLAPGAEKVQTTAGSVPKSCSFRGDVMSKDINTSGLSKAYVHNKQLIVLKNQAAQRGANVLLVTWHKGQNKPQYIVSQGKYVDDISKHEMEGKAYSCSPEALRKLKAFEMPN